MGDSKNTKGKEKLDLSKFTPESKKAYRDGKRVVRIKVSNTK